MVLLQYSPGTDDRMRKRTFNAREFGQVIHNQFAGMYVVVDER